MSEATIGKKMIAPKIHGHSMQEIFCDGDMAEWESRYNNGQLSFSSYLTDGNGRCSVYLNDDRIYQVGVSYGEDKLSPQEATDKAVAWLNQLSNLLKNLGFGLT